MSSILIHKNNRSHIFIIFNNHALRKCLPQKAKRPAVAGRFAWKWTGSGRQVLRRQRHEVRQAGVLPQLLLEDGSHARRHFGSLARI